MKVYPTAIAGFAIMALKATSSGTVPNIVERLIVDVAEYTIKILTEGHIAISMNHSLISDTKTR